MSKYPESGGPDDGPIDTEGMPGQKLREIRDKLRKKQATIGRLTFRPMPGKIVVRVIGDNEMIGSGILYGAPTREVPRTTGRVIAVYEPFLIGDNQDIESKPYVDVGDIVIFGQFTGTKVEVERTVILILKEHDILTIVDVDGDPEKELANVEAER